MQSERAHCRDGNQRHASGRVWAVLWKVGARVFQQVRGRVVGQHEGYILSHPPCKVRRLQLMLFRSSQATISDIGTKDLVHGSLIQARRAQVVLFLYDPPILWAPNEDFGRRNKR